MVHTEQGGRTDDIITWPPCTADCCHCLARAAAAHMNVETVVLCSYTTVLDTSGKSFA